MTKVLLEAAECAIDAVKALNAAVSALTTPDADCLPECIGLLRARDEVLEVSQRLLAKAALTVSA